MSSRGVLDFLIKFAFCREDTTLTLAHVFRKPSSGEELMGKKFMREQPGKYLDTLQKAKDRLVEKGFDPNRIDINLLSDPYPTVAEGIIDLYNKGDYDMIVLGRKRMSKAEEFVLGDPSIKLVRALGEAAVLIIKSQ